MITRIPALEFMQAIVGSYQTQDQLVKLQVTGCGYGQSVQLLSNNKVQMAGIIGAAGNGIELYAHVGLPNVLKLTGQLEAANTVAFQENELPITIRFTRNSDSLTLVITLHDAQKISHVLQRT
jgi:hypothetical protein